MAETLSDQQKAELREWINAHLGKTKTNNRLHTSYGLKHLVESRVGFYVSNDDMKAAMLDCGFTAKRVDELCCSYNVSERSISRAELLPRAR